MATTLYQPSLSSAADVPLCVVLAHGDPTRNHAEVVDAGEPQRVKIRFNLQRDSDGWPPAESEGLWAEPLGEDSFRIDNVPWFVAGLAIDDVVRALAGSDGVLWATEFLARSGRITIRIIPSMDGPLDGEPRAALDLLSAVGVTGEIFPEYRMLALDVPADADLARLKAVLRDGESDGTWNYEEGAVTDEWLSL